MLKLSTKCRISSFNAQGSRGVIVAVQVRAVKIYLAAVEALRKTKIEGETQESGNHHEFHPLDYRGLKHQKPKGCSKRLNINFEGCADFVQSPKEYPFLCNVHPQRPAA
jgi:hypothetical protein